MITCDDWREAPPEAIAPLFDAECTRWYETLGWDYRPSCLLLEAARVRRRLPGFLVRDAAGRITGWAYFLLHDGTLHVGNLVADENAVIGALFDAVARAPETRQAARLSCFLYPTSPAIETALRRRRFAIERHTYMQMPLSSPVAKRRPAGASDYRVRAWTAYSLPDLVGLFARAYEGMPQSRCFAPDGRVDQWTSYVAQLIQTPACGRFEQALSMTMEAQAGELAGAVLVTALADRTAHIAQMAVAAPHRGRGLGRELVESACDRAAAAHYDRMTLIVAESNDRAWRLYDRLGFEPAARFVFADKRID